jgi:hypothetical protein
LAGILVHIVGLLVGAILAGAGWHLLGVLVGHPPRWVFGIVTAAMAVVAAGLLPIHLDGSRWRVPREWSDLGRVWYAGIFGAALGTGLVTALASPGLYAVFAWGLTAATWSAVWPVFLAFGLGRALPFATIGLGAYVRARRVSSIRDSFTRIDAEVQAVLHRFNARVARLAPAEAVIAAAVAALFLVG